MGTDLIKGTTYVDGGTITAANLNAHVDDAVLNYTTISARTAKPAGAVTDEFLINDSGTLKKITGTVLYDMVTQAGAVIQSTYATHVNYASASAVIPQDDTIPQISEGTLFLTVSFTPRFANSRMVIRYSGALTASGALIGIVAIFRDTAGTNAITARLSNVTATNVIVPVSIIATDLPATTSTITYTVRIGPGAAGTIYVNGNNAARLLGGASMQTLEVQEVRVP